MGRKKTFPFFQYFLFSPAKVRISEESTKRKSNFFFTFELDTIKNSRQSRSLAGSNEKHKINLLHHHLHYATVRILHDVQALLRSIEQLTVDGVELLDLES